MWAVIVNDDSGRGRGEFLSAKPSRGVLRGWRQEGNTIILRDSIIIIYVYVYVYYLRGGKRERIVRYRADSGGGAREPRVPGTGWGGHVIVFAS